MRTIGYLGFCLSLLSFLYVKPSSASHFQASEIFYDYTGDSTGIARHYKISLILYRRLGSTPMPPTADIRIKSSCYPTTTLTVAVDSNHQSLPALQFKQCIDSILFPDVTTYLYQGYVVLPGTCTDFQFIYSYC